MNLKKGRENTNSTKPQITKAKMFIIFERTGKTLSGNLYKKVSQLLVKRKNDFSHRQSKAAKNI